ncbi:MAG: hypothetical protein ACXVJ8_16965 [Candidatus Angelobacter sp.]
MQHLQRRTPGCDGVTPARDALECSRDGLPVGIQITGPFWEDVC